MGKLIAFLILTAALVALAVLVTMEHRPSGLAMPLLVDAAAPDCPKLANPCDRINCNRRPTREIA